MTRRSIAGFVSERSMKTLKDFEMSKAADASRSFPALRPCSYHTEAIRRVLTFFLLTIRSPPRP
jgi:hypothetical protein